jgi:2-oxoisovalerate dehydrogenase E1 component
VIANLEADKAVTELSSPVEGEVLELLAEEGEMVKVGASLVRVKVDEARTPVKPISREEPGTPTITRVARQVPTRRPAVSAPAAPAEPVVEQKAETMIGIAGITVNTGSRKISNEYIAERCKEWTAESILKRVGIASRYWIGEGETAVTLGTGAARELLVQSGLGIRDIDLIICTTGTPPTTTPSTAGLILHELSDGAEDVYVQAHDINAACSGYLYGLQAAYDYLNTRPDRRVLLVTTETLSQKLDPTDPSTAPIFGDAATATLVLGTGHKGQIRARLWPPVLSAKGENGSILAVPSQAGESIFMDGPKVFVEAINGMIKVLSEALDEAGKTVDDLALVVPHQANQRIINAIGLKLRAKDRMYSNIAEYGNTSSSTIPICLEKLLGERQSGDLLGLAAFGGGFTIGGGLVQIL